MTVSLVDSQCHGEHMAGASGHEVLVHPNVLLQELPQHREDQQLHQLSELLLAKGASNKQKDWQANNSSLYCNQLCVSVETNSDQVDE